MAKQKTAHIQGVYESIKIISALGLGFETGSVLKNIISAQKAESQEEELEELKKAQFYLNARISNIETEQKRAGWRKTKKTARKKAPAVISSTGVAGG